MYHWHGIILTNKKLLQKTFNSLSSQDAKDFFIYMFYMYIHGRFSRGSLSDSSLSCLCVCLDITSLSLLHLLHTQALLKVHMHLFSASVLLGPSILFVFSLCLLQTSFRTAFITVFSVFCWKCRFSGYDSVLHSGRCTVVNICLSIPLPFF